MDVKITYNSLINSALEKLGTRKGLIVEISEVNIETAKKLLEMAKDLVSVRVTAKDYVTYINKNAVVLGHTIAKVTSKKSGAYIPPSVRVIQGGADSGGSMKYVETIIGKDSIFEFEVPRFIFNKYKDKYEKYTVELAQALNIDDLI